MRIEMANGSVIEDGPIELRTRMVRAERINGQNIVWLDGKPNVVESEYVEIAEIPPLLPYLRILKAGDLL
jgi:hypothetical protein